MSETLGSAGLAAIAARVRAGRGLAHKQDLAPLLARLGLGGEAGVRVGDDCAAIPDGDGWLLLAIEGFLPEFVADDPWFAGYCGVMVNASDVAAMGGRAVAVVDAVWGGDGAQVGGVLDGLAAGAAAYGVPVVGGHSNARSGTHTLAVAILGRAARLLTSFDAAPGDVLLAAIDLRGGYREPASYWDASSEVSRRGEAGRLRGDLALLPAIAEAGLSRAAKDISMAGLVGTALMLAECSGVGVTIAIDDVPRPPGADLARWLLAFPSFGYLLAAKPGDVAAIETAFAARGIACAAIGACERGQALRLARDGEVATVWDHGREALLGCGAAVA